MPLAPSPVPRQRLHLRRISYDGWQREDGLFDVEAHIVDTKERDYLLASGVRPAGEPVHDMWVRMTIDRHCTIQAIDVAVDGVPYPGGCDALPPNYAKLVGTNLLHGFRRNLYDAAGGVHGCTHVTELLAFLPTAAMQTFATLKRDFDPSSGEKPYQLNRCHALEHSSQNVRRYYPKWYREPAEERNA
jgi:hypothetical protein